MYLTIFLIAGGIILLSIGFIITRDEAVFFFVNWREGTIPYPAPPGGSKARFHPGASVLAEEWQYCGR